jgi:hypothetical protein
MANTARTIIGYITITGSLLDLDVVTTSDGGSTTLNNDIKPKIMAIGTGVLHWFNLDDATTLRENTWFAVENASSEFIGVKNSDSTVWVRLGPHESCVCTLVDNSTAAGVWHVVTKSAGDEYCFEETEYALIGAPAVGGGKLNWINTKSGVGYVSAFTAPNSASVYGRLFNQKGTGIAGYTALHMYSSAFSLTKTAPRTVSVTFGGIELNDGLANATDDYWCDVGLGDEFTDAAHTDAICFRYDINIAVTGANWHRVMAAGAGENVASTGIAAQGIGFYNDMRFEVCSAADRVDFWIGKQHAGTETSNIPTAYMGPFMRIVGRAGTALRDFNASYFKIKANLV